MPSRRTYAKINSLEALSEIPEKERFREYMRYLIDQMPSELSSAAIWRSIGTTDSIMSKYISEEETGYYVPRDTYLSKIRTCFSRNIPDAFGDGTLFDSLVELSRSVTTGYSNRFKSAPTQKELSDSDIERREWFGEYYNGARAELNLRFEDVASYMAQKWERKLEDSAAKVTVSRWSGGYEGSNFSLPKKEELGFLIELFDSTRQKIITRSPDASIGYDPVQMREMYDISRLVRKREDAVNEIKLPASPAHNMIKELLVEKYVSLDATSVDDVYRAYGLSKGDMEHFRKGGEKDPVFAARIVTAFGLELKERDDFLVAAQPQLQRKPKLRDRFMEVRGHIGLDEELRSLYKIPAQERWGRYISDLLAVNGKSQEELCTATGINRTQISCWINARKLPKPEDKEKQQPADERVGGIYNALTELCKNPPPIERSVFDELHKSSYDAMQSALRKATSGAKAKKATVVTTREKPATEEKRKS